LLDGRSGLLIGLAQPLAGPGRDGASELQRGGQSPDGGLNHIFHLGVERIRTPAYPAAVPQLIGGAPEHGVHLQDGL
jgi:hypothetical protein